MRPDCSADWLGSWPVFWHSFFCFAGLPSFFPSLTQLAARKWSALPPIAIQVVIGLILLLSALLLFLGLRFLLRKMLSEQIAGVADKLFGALMGMMSGALLGLCVLSVVSLVPNESVYRRLSEKSMIGAWVCERLTPWLHPKMMELPVFNGEETE